MSKIFATYFRRVLLLLSLAGCGLMGCGEDDTETGDTETGDTDIGDAVEPRFQALVKAVEDELATLGAPGVAVAVVEGGEVTFAKGFGSRRRDGEDPIIETTLFRIASVTKMLTAVSLLQLVEEGLVDLDAPIADFLPDFDFDRDATWIEKITVRHLLTHSSAIADYLEVDTAEDLKNDDALSEYMNGEFGEFAYVMAPPGRMYNYTNPGYMLAGLITETVSGTPYRDNLRENVLEPLGMKRTFLLPDEVISDGDFACGDTIDWVTSNPLVVEPDTYDNGWARPAGYVFSSVLDLAEFIAFLRSGNPDVLADDLRAAMQEPQIDTELFLDLIYYGYGLLIQEGGFLDKWSSRYYDMRMLNHSGAIPGFSADLYYVPELDFGFITLANGDGAYFQNSFLTALSTLTELPDPSSSPPDLHVDIESYDSCVGEYYDEFNTGHVIVTRDGNRLLVEMPDVDAASIPYEPVLQPIIPYNFTLEVQGTQLQLTFVLDEDGDAEYFRTRSFVATRIDEEMEGAAQSLPAAYPMPRFATTPEAPPSVRFFRPVAGSLAW